MTLDEYRTQLLEKLKACGEPLRVQELLSDAELMLAGTQISPLGQRTFWQSLSADLDVMSQRSVLLPDVAAASALRALIAAARGAIAQYKRLLEGASTTPDPDGPIS